MKTITGNLLDITSGTILHQTNCRGVCVGLAGALRRKWPEAFNIYNRATEHLEDDALGQVWIGQSWEGIEIAHVFGQVKPGPNTDLRAVESALAILASCSYEGPLYAPWQMGCGLGGGD